MSILAIAGIVTKEPEFLRDLAAQEPWAQELCGAIGMKTVSFYMEPYDHWPNGAPSWIQFVEESGISAHTYPEVSAMELILHSCVLIPDATGVAMTIIDKLGLAVARHYHIKDFNFREYTDGPTNEFAWPDQVRIRGAYFRRQLQGTMS